MRATCLLWVIVLVNSACATLPTGESTAIQTTLAEVLKEYQGDNDQFGVLFARFNREFSAVEVAGDIAPDDHLRLGSASKVFLSFMFLREGLGLDESIREFYLDHDHPHTDVITARMLLNHTSGVPDEMVRRVRQFGDGIDPGVAVRALQPILSAPAWHTDGRIAASYSRELGLDFDPGTLWCYSNTGYMMLGRMLERSTNTPIESLLASHFGRVAPSLYLDDGRDSNFPVSYLAPWPIHYSHPWVAGGLIATAPDALAAFHHISEQPEFKTMQEWANVPRCPADIVFGDDYGLGLQRYALEGIGEAIGHDGNIIARSFLFRLEDTSYLVHTTRAVTNAALKLIAERLLAAER